MPRRRRSFRKCSRRSRSSATPRSASGTTSSAAIRLRRRPAPADPAAAPRWTYSTGPQTYPFDLNDMFGGGGAGEGEGGGGFADLFKQFSRGGGGGGGVRAAGRPRQRSQARADGSLRHGRSRRRSGRLRPAADGNLETIKVKIPAGIDDGKRIRLRGQGEPGEGDAPAGDILVTIHVSPHPYFRRTGNRLDVRVPVTLAEAAQGAKIDVPTP